MIRRWSSFFILLSLLFLSQGLVAQFSPIEYPMLEVSGYNWKLSRTEVALAEADFSFLEMPTLDDLLEADWKRDAKLYTSVMAFFTGDGIPDPGVLDLESGIVVECHKKRGVVLFSSGEGLRGKQILLLADGSKNLLEGGKVSDFYLPGNFVFRGMDGKNPRLEVTPSWPENYSEIKIGDFSLLFQGKDRRHAESFLSYAEPALGQLRGKLNELFGFETDSSVPIIIPPNLESYAKLFRENSNQPMSWWPLAFHNCGYVALWPLSLPRYNDPEGHGEKYFREKDLLRLVYHEVAHLAALEEAGCLTQIPVWLDEGIAVYFSAEIQTQIKTSYPRLLKEKKGLLPWDSLVEEGFTEFAEAQSHLMYLQSYAMVAYLLEEYGKEKLRAYVQSFQNGKEWKNQFETIYGESWESNHNKFEKSLFD